MKIKSITIRTNDKCEKCGGFLLFEVRDEYTDRRKNKTRAGIWKCTICERATLGVVIRNVEIKAVA